MATTTAADLISASRSLDPASRALLNLWLHRGLDDLAIAHLSGGSPEEVAERRQRLVDRLAEEVGSPPGEVRATLDAMAGGSPAREAVAEARVEGDGPDRIDRLETPGGVVLVGGDDADRGHPADLVVPTEPGADPDAPDPAIVVPGAPSDAPDPAIVVPGAPSDAQEPALVVPGRPEAPADPELYLPATADVPTADDDPAERPELIVPEAEARTPAPTRTQTQTETPAARRAAEREQERRRRQDAGPAGPRSSPFPAALGFALGTVIVVMVAIAALTGGGSEGGGEGQAATSTPSPTPTPSATASAAATPAAARSAPVTLEPVAGGPAGVRGTLVMEADRVRLSVEGLDRPAADYEVWLFNSVADARSLGRLDARTFRLPRDRRRYRYLDVSLESGADRAPAHSGRTVLRTAVPR